MKNLAQNNQSCQADDMKLIHYGSKKFEINKFDTIVNDYWIKPRGGLWCSPLNSRFGWNAWCDAEYFKDCNIDNSFTFILSESAKIYTINSISDLNNLPKVKDAIRDTYVDFEQVAKTYDAIFMTKKGLSEIQHKSIHFNWDCESVLILKTDNIIF